MSRRHIRRHFRAPGWPRNSTPLALFVDGVALSSGRLTLPRLVGAGVSMFVAWNIGTALGATALHAVPDLLRHGVDVIVPLTFLAVLVPLVRTRAAALTALVAAVATLLLMQLAPGGIVVLGASLAGSAAGAWWSQRTRTAPAITGPDAERQAR